MVSDSTRSSSAPWSSAQRKLFSISTRFSNDIPERKSAYSSGVCITWAASVGSIGASFRGSGRE